MEIWKDVPGYEGMYQVSNMGNVRGLDRYSDSDKRQKLKGKMMAFHIHHKGYIKVLLTKNGQAKMKFVHILVAAAFIGPTPKGKQVNHMNGKKADNRPENLEYCTASYNILHSHRKLGKTSNLQGEKHWAAKLTKKDVLDIRRLYTTGNYTHKSLANIFGVQAPAIGKIINRQHWTHI